jgi:AraC-like DNA-binding protein
VGRGDFNAKPTRVELHRLWMQRFSEDLPRVVEAATKKERAYISFRVRPGPDLLQAGVEIEPSAVLRHGQTHEYYQRSSGSVSFGTMSLPVEDIASLGQGLAGVDLTTAREAMSITPAPAATAKLQRLHAAAGQLAEDAPEIIAHPEAARGLEQALIEALFACLGEGVAGEDRSALRHHATIMRRFRRAVEESPDQPLYIPELCKAIGVSDRTLRVCCQEQLGMSPKRYLLLRRMHLARRALRDSTPGTATVTEIATQYGFWQFGRFAGEYKALFGEAPSATLNPPRQ